MDTLVKYPTVVTKCFFEKAEHNNVLYESENFIMLPSLGALVEGWVLIVPKQHYISIGALNEDLFDELEILEKEVLDILQMEYGPIVTFEHGAINFKKSIGCGVDYAHLHFVPIEYDLKYGVSKYLSLNFDWKMVNSIRETIKYYKQNTEYLFIKNQVGESYIAGASQVPSQLFRKVIANYLNKPEKYNWKTNSELDKITRTIKRLKKYMVKPINFSCL